MMSLRMQLRQCSTHECSICGSNWPEEMTLREKLVLSGNPENLVAAVCIETGCCPSCGTGIYDGPLPEEVVERWLERTGVVVRLADGTTCRAYRCPDKAVGLPFDLTEVP